VPLTLRQTQALSSLARELYRLLPGTPHPYADAAISFQGVAHDLGVGAFWRGGSKEPAIVYLLTSILTRQPERFCALLTLIVQRGLTYRSSKGTPLTREEIGLINASISEAGFKIPELWEQDFLQTLSSVPAAVVDSESPTVPSVSVLDELSKAFNDLLPMEPQQRGFAFERFLGNAFASFAMAPRGSFRLAGEQIDGSFQLDGETYLMEARWQNVPTGKDSLNAFSAKVRSKADWTRGLFVSHSGFGSEGLAAFSQGTPTNIVCMDGLDIHTLLHSRHDLREVIRRKTRRAAETNLAFVPVRELLT